MSETILLTGATGFIGSHLLEELINQNYEVIILKRSFSNTWRIDHLLNDVTSYDIDKVPIENIFDNHGINYVVHLATYYKKTHEYNDIEELMESNITIPTKILEQMRLHSVDYFINTGTFFEYELNSKLIGENQKRRPYNLYASSKIAFSEVLQYYANNYNIKAVDLKLYAPYGPKDNEKLMVYLIKNFINKTSFNMTPCEQKWNWTYVKDIVEAYVKALKYIKKMKSNYEVFNIGYDKSYSIKEVINTLEKITGISNLVNYDKQYNENEIFYVCCDNTKVKNILGWIPKYDLNKGLKEMYQYYMEGENER
jgi:nucleoside-diphosphate-sugar epimerase